MVLQFCVYVEMRFKQALGCYRPVEYNAEVQPMITTPGHGTFPMGHATQAYAVVQVLKTLLGLDPKKPGQKMVIDQLRRQAARNRNQPRRGGIAFPGRRHGGAHAGCGFGRVLLRTVHRQPDLYEPDIQGRGVRDRRIPHHRLQSV
jgi:hypothetical protein